MTDQAEQNVSAHVACIIQHLDMMKYLEYFLFLLDF